MIVIPMAGMSNRFLEQGYTIPKYMLPLCGRPVFDHSVASFSAYFADQRFLFIARDVARTPSFIAMRCAALGIQKPQIHIVPAPTAGQAETVLLGIDAVDVSEDESITIFNIDTFRPGFRFPKTDWSQRSDGYLEVFHGSGTNWSYVRPAIGLTPLVLETAEKRPLSDLCCTGLYYFHRASDFRLVARAGQQRPCRSELFIAPLYNDLIAAGRKIHYDVISRDEVTFCGVPAEYALLRRGRWSFKQSNT